MDEARARIPTCPYCQGRDQKHGGSCPLIGSQNTRAYKIREWRAGRRAALNERANTKAGNPFYTLGYMSGMRDRPRDSRPNTSRSGPAERVSSPGLDPREAFEREMAARERDIF